MTMDFIISFNTNKIFANLEPCLYLAFTALQCTVWSMYSLNISTLSGTKECTGCIHSVYHSYLFFYHSFWGVGLSDLDGQVLADILMLTSGLQTLM